MRNLIDNAISFLTIVLVSFVILYLVFGLIPFLLM